MEAFSLKCVLAVSQSANVSLDWHQPRRLVSVSSSQTHGWLETGVGGVVNAYTMHLLSAC